MDGNISLRSWFPFSLHVAFLVRNIHSMNSLEKNNDFLIIKDIQEKDFVILLGIGKNNDLVFLSNPIFVENE